MPAGRSLGEETEEIFQKLEFLSAMCTHAEGQHLGTKTSARSEIRQGAVIRWFTNLSGLVSDEGR